VSVPASQEQGPASSPGRRRRAILGLVLVAVGLAGLLWGVLQITSAGFGTQPTASFAERRGYDQVKRDVHEVFPFALLRSLAGLVLLLGGLRLLQPPLPDLTEHDEHEPERREV
jgi:hypothetical protein